MSYDIQIQFSSGQTRDFKNIDYDVREDAKLLVIYINVSLDHIMFNVRHLLSWRVVKHVPEN